MTLKARRASAATTGPAGAPLVVPHWAAPPAPPQRQRHVPLPLQPPQPYAYLFRYACTYNAAVQSRTVLDSAGCMRRHASSTPAVTRTAVTHTRFDSPASAAQAALQHSKFNCSSSAVTSTSLGSDRRFRSGFGMRYGGPYHARPRRASATASLCADMCEIGAGGGSSARADTEPNRRRSNHEWTGDQAGRQR